jgi:hypothetical protein
MDTIENGQAATTESAPITSSGRDEPVTEFDPTFLNHVRLLQIEQAVKFLHFYHNAEGAYDPLSRGRRILFYLFKSAHHLWRPSLYADAENEDQYVGPEYDPLQPEDCGDELFLKDVWVKLRKSWQEDMSVQEATRKAWLLFIDFSTTHSDFTRRHDIEETSLWWDILGSSEREAFFREYFSIDAATFARWISDIETLQVEDPSVRDTKKFATAWRTFKAAHDGDYMHQLLSNVWCFELGSLGGELRHWATFIESYRPLLRQDLFEMFVEKSCADEPNFKGLPASKEELKDDECPICYRAFIMADSDKPAGEVHPVKIPCAHIFCGECIANHSKVSGSQMRCPLCRAVIYEIEVAYDDQDNWDGLVAEVLIRSEAEEQQALGEEAIHAFDKYMATLPARVIDDSKFDLVNDSLADLGNHVFGPTDQVLTFFDRYRTDQPAGHISMETSRDLHYHVGIAGMVSIRNRLEAYLQGDADKYRHEVKRELQIRALHDTLLFSNWLEFY